MIRLLHKYKIFVFLIMILTLFAQLTLQSNAQEKTGTVSGRVVDIDGHPVPKLPIYIAPLGIGGGFTDTVYFPNQYSLLHQTQTDGVGRFTISGIPTGSFYFGVLPYNINKQLPHDFEKDLEHFLHVWNSPGYTSEYIDALIYNNFGLAASDYEPDVKIQSLRVQGINFYTTPGTEEIAFGIDTGTHIENVEVIIKPRMRVQGRVLFNDGTPLANARLKIRADYRSESSSGGTRARPWTDEEGYFVTYLNENYGAPIYTYTISVEYQDLEETAEPIQLAPGDRLDNLTFTLDSPPIAPKPIPPITKPENNELEPSTKPKSSKKPVSNEVWIVNPANRHAYKRILCETVDDAIVQATDEKAHLVTINDEKEQKWLGAVFGHELYWIGLSDTKKEGEWQWQNGEPVKYQNWLPDDYFSETWDADERDNVVITFEDGKWYAVSQNSVIVKMTKMAIIEKADLKINLPEKKKRP
ncbi:MAG: lectin-like protein [Candidatus Poribacteria bacterium]|nr:lectin-like protein [Candidatus Poribacteria bacterium]